MPPLAKPFGPCRPAPAFSASAGFNVRRDAGFVQPDHNKFDGLCTTYPERTLGSPSDQRIGNAVEVRIAAEPSGGMIIPHVLIKTNYN
jgi:hypothetical protein